MCYNKRKIEVNMVDKYNILVLEALGNLLLKDGFLIIDKEDIFSNINEASFDKSMLTDIMQELKNAEFIEIKYFDGSSYCVAITLRGRRAIDDNRELVRQKLEEERKKQSNILANEVKKVEVKPVVPEVKPIKPEETKHLERKEKINKKIVQKSNNIEVTAPVQNAEKTESVKNEVANSVEETGVTAVAEVAQNSLPAVVAMPKVKSCKVFFAAFFGGLLGAIIGGGAINFLFSYIL